MFIELCLGDGLLYGYMIENRCSGPPNLNRTLSVDHSWNRISGDQLPEQSAGRIPVQINQLGDRVPVQINQSGDRIQVPMNQSVNRQSIMEYRLYFEESHFLILGI